MESAKLVEQLWSRIQARDWPGVGELLAEDFVLEWPQDLVRLRGRAEFRGVQPQLSGRLVDRGAPDRRGGEHRGLGGACPPPDVGPHYALSFFEVDAGRIASCREYWVKEAYEEPVGERARWFEPM